jgi:hypothetical protein
MWSSGIFEKTFRICAGFHGEGTNMPTGSKSSGISTNRFILSIFPFIAETFHRQKRKISVIRSRRKENVHERGGRHPLSMEFRFPINF